MRELEKTGQFRRDLKKVAASGVYSLEEIERVIAILANDIPLPESMRDHALSGPWKSINARDCHVYPDLLLIYAKPPGVLSLLRIASHSELGF